MTSPLNIGISGMQAAQMRVNAAAINIVNAPGIAPADSAEQTLHTPVDVTNSTGPDGQVIANVRAREPAFIPSPNIDGETLVTANTFIPEEVVTLNSASRAYQASAALIRTVDEMEQDVLDIKS